MSGPARLAGAVAGGLVAELGITVMLMSGERKAGGPSKLVVLERSGARKLGLGVPPDTELPGTAEQAFVQAGHLLLSAAAGAAYALAIHRDARMVPSGIGFGLAFYAAMHWIVGPVFGLKKPEWQSDPKIIAIHTLDHIGFGLVTAAGAKLADGR